MYKGRSLCLQILQITLRILNFKLALAQCSDLNLVGSTWSPKQLNSINRPICNLFVKCISVS